MITSCGIITPIVVALLVLFTLGRAPVGLSLPDESSDPTCAHGILGVDNHICCTHSCGRCSGKGCGSLPGGAENCCANKISASGHSCATSNAPCVMHGAGPNPPPPPPPPTPPTPPLPPGPINASAVVALMSPHIFTVDERFVSYTLDSSAWRSLNLSDPTLILLARALSPSVLRVGGTQGDYDVYAIGPDYIDFDCGNPPPPMTSYRCKTVTEVQLEQLLTFSARANASLVYGLSDMFGRPTKTKPEHRLCGSNGQGPCPPRNLSNTKALLKWAAAREVWSSSNSSYPIHSGSQRIVPFHRPASTPLLSGSFWAFELGNELNSALNGAAGAQTQASDFASLRTAVQAAYSGNNDDLVGKSGSGTTEISYHNRERMTSRASQLHIRLLIGPDTHSAAEFEDSGRAWYAGFANSALQARAADIFTFHMYSIGDGPKIDPSRLNDSFLSPTALDKAGQGARTIVGVVRAASAKSARPMPPVWAGETAAANNGGHTGVTDTYIDGFWYLDQLGSHAAAGVSVVCRQTLESSAGYPLVENYLPLPDYWLALLWHQIMGQRVLNVTSVSGNYGGGLPLLRIYAHCASSRGGWAAGTVAVAWANLAPRVTNLSLPGLSSMSGSGALIWVLQPGEPIDGAVNPLQSRQVRLNGGSVLSVQAGPTLPKMPGMPVTNSNNMPSSTADTITLPPASYGFAVFPSARASGCA